MNSVFFTLSAADHQWHDLQRHLPRFDEYQRAISDNQRARIVRDNIQNSPHIIAWYLCRRYRLFFKHVIQPKFNVIDYWFRYEWQSRGSGHIHGFFYSSDAPVADMRTETSRRGLAMYWGNAISAVNPNPTRLPDGRHPSSLPFHQQVNSKDYCAALINRFGRHTQHSEAYCLRKDRASGEVKCRFYYPRPLRDEAAICCRNGEPGPPAHKSQWAFSAQRNDPLLQAFSPIVTLGWLANGDLSPSTSIEAVLKYAAKYCTKDEVKSQSYRQIAQTVCSTVTHSRAPCPMTSVVAKVLNRFVGERDWSAQEVCHQLMGEPLVETSRVVVTLYCFPINTGEDTFEITDNDIVRQESIIDKYRVRSPAVELVTLLDYARHYNWSTNRPRPRARPRVISYFPRYPSNREDIKYEDFCRVKMMLHHPFRVVDDLLLAFDEHFTTWTEAYDYCRRHHQGTHAPDTLDATEEETLEEEEFEANEQQVEADLIQEGWEVLAAGVPGHEHVEDEPTDLGLRNMDVEYDWHSHA
ncbi:hypothetical protein GX50_09011, partial [[Emmonsia] crescens]